MSSLQKCKTAKPVSFYFIFYLNSKILCKFASKIKKRSELIAMLKENGWVVNSQGTVFNESYLT